MAVSQIETAGLVERARSDPNAFAELYLAHYKRVFGYCVHRLFDRHCAEDVTSDVFFKVMHNLRSFEGDDEGFRHWLYRIATNAVNDFLRSKKRRAEAIERIGRNAQAESDFTLPCDEELLEKKAFVQEALLELKPKYQTVITMRFFEKMRLTEIAACLGKDPSTVRTWLARGTARLRSRLETMMKDRR
jgi:RNA polymerase sigma-70 factor (ECF subfamily)